MAVATRSAGILVYRRTRAPGRPAGDADAAVEVLIGHLGGPFWARKQEHAWSAPKGEQAADEEPLAAAQREFLEETGQPVPHGDLLDLGTVRQSGAKLVTLWAVEGDLDAAALVSNTFALEWPPRSGRTQQFPELDRFAWAEVGTARELLVKGQLPFLDRLLERLTTTG
jgi:predicted NUDIX family NTP pyrophosphohydrolase